MSDSLGTTNVWPSWYYRLVKHIRLQLSNGFSPSRSSGDAVRASASIAFGPRVIGLLILKYLRRRRIAWVSLIAVMLCTTMVLVVISVMGGWLDMFEASARGLTGDWSSAPTLWPASAGTRR